MKTIAMIVCLLGLAAGANAFNTESQLLLKDGLAGAYKDGKSVSIGELAGGSGEVEYQINTEDHGPIVFKIVSAGDNRFNVFLDGHFVENVSGEVIEISEDSILHTKTASLKIRAVTVNGRKMMVCRVVYDAMLNFTQVYYERVTKK
ncbi:MAG: hypothetical protein WCW52_07835 [Elusimicrobiales bacterium]